MNNDKSQGDEEGKQQPQVLPFAQRRMARQQVPVVETVAGEQHPPPPPPPDNAPPPIAEETIHPAPSGPKPHPHHRGVSWGDVNVSFAPAEEFMTNSTETMPTAGGASSPSSSRRLMTGQEAYEAAEAALRGHNNNHDNAPPERINSMRVKLDDLMQLAPMETEAETHILRALEQNDLAVAPDSSSDMAILGNVPHEALYPPVPLPPMEDEDEMQQQQRQQSSAARLAKNSNRSLGSGERPLQVVPTTPTYTTPVVDAVWNTDFIELPLAAMPPAAPSTRSFRNLQAMNNNQHRRQKTMEQTLN
eukprot:scaffold3227_cov214-Amphora_coffeaeformis.AAC.1